VILSDEEAAAGKSFRNLSRVSAVPVSDAGVADVIRAASLLVSQAALPELVTRAGDRAPRATATGEEDAA
jgi:large subunit ribosomal protein L4